MLGHFGLSRTDWIWYIDGSISMNNVYTVSCGQMRRFSHPRFSTAAGLENIFDLVF